MRPLANAARHTEEWYDHDGAGSPAQASGVSARRDSLREPSREGGASEPARISKENGTYTDANGDDAESEPGASQSGESVSMPRAGERAFLGPGHAALHQRVLYANVERTADAPHRLRAPEKRTLGLGGYLGRLPDRLRA